MIKLDNCLSIVAALYCGIILLWLILRLCADWVPRVSWRPQTLDQLHLSQQPGTESRERPGREEQVKPHTMYHECRPTYNLHCTHIYSKHTCTQTVKHRREFLVYLQDSIYLRFRSASSCCVFLYDLNRNTELITKLEL